MGMQYVDTLGSCPVFICKWYVSWSVLEWKTAFLTSYTAPGMGDMEDKYLNGL